jgi:hypothetical protein
MFLRKIFGCSIQTKSIQEQEQKQEQELRKIAKEMLGSVYGNILKKTDQETAITWMAAALKGLFNVTKYNSLFCFQKDEINNSISSLIFNNAKFAGFALESKSQEYQSFNDHSMKTSSFTCYRFSCSNMNNQLAVNDFRSIIASALKYKHPHLLYKPNSALITFMLINQFRKNSPVGSLPREVVDQIAMYVRRNAHVEANIIAAKLDDDISLLRARK